MTRATLTYTDSINELNEIHDENERLRESLKAIAGWASDRGPLKGKGPMDVSAYARAAIAKAEGK